MKMPDADGVAHHQRGAHHRPSARVGRPALRTVPAPQLSRQRFGERDARAVRSASSTWARLIMSGGMKRTVLMPQDSSSSPLWKARVSTASHSASAGARAGAVGHQLHADHQSLAAHVADALEALLQLAQPREEILADLRGVGGVFALHQLEGGEGRRAAQRVAAEGVAVRAALPLLHDACGAPPPGRSAARSPGPWRAS